MNNRLRLGLAVGAGCLLGRTKKAKLAFGIGTLVMGKRLQLSPRAIAEADQVFLGITEAPPCPHPVPHPPT